MKIRKIEKLQDLLDRDFAWRKKELIDLQLMIHSTNNKTICRMGLALLSAHFEGFIKLAANYYVIFVASQNLKINQLQFNFMAIHCSEGLKACNETQKISVYSRELEHIVNNYSNQKFHVRYSQDKPLVKTGGNPSSLVLKEILDSIGLDFMPYETKKNYIDADLLSNRHGIVHGEKIFITEDEFDNTMMNVLEIMEIFKEQVLSAAIDKHYLKQDI